MVDVRRFRDRSDAGRQLAERLAEYRDRPDVIVLALPRGGVPVGAEIARALGAPLDVFVVRKLGVPGHEELAMGALASGGARVINDVVVRRARISDAALDAVTAREQAEVTRRERLYRGDRPPPDVRGRTVLLVDDGLATGATMRAAVEASRQSDPRRIIVAVPVGSPETCASLRRVAEDVVCLATPEPFVAVGFWYEDFGQVSDEEVRAALDAPTVTEQSVEIPTGDAVLAGDLSVPSNARALVLFAHGSGSSRRSPRNRAVAATLQGSRLATLLFDLLTSAEEEVDLRTRALRFDVEFLARRLLDATRWVQGQPEVSARPVGYFGASTGAAAALIAAAELREIQAVVSRGGRPDLAGDALERVQAPTLLIVGSRDEVVLRLNREAASRMRAHEELVEVPGATHLFDEPGTLEQVARLAAEWFERHLTDD
jgi:putative phosphoribosyl transferase